MTTEQRERTRRLAWEGLLNARDLGGYPAVLAWLERVSSQPGYIPITQG